jgi:hypothetical protein
VREWAIALWCCCVVHCSFLFLCSAGVVYGSYIHSVCAIVCASDCAIASAIAYGTMRTTVCFVKCTAIVATENAVQGVAVTICC